MHTAEGYWSVCVDLLQLKAWVKRKLSLDADQLEAIWHELYRGKWLAEYEQGALTTQDIIDEAETHANVLRNTERPDRIVRPSPPSRGDRGAIEKVEVSLDAYSARRASTFSDVAAMLAERQASVRAFRSECLRGVEVRLGEEEAGAWLYGNHGSADVRERLHVLAGQLSRAYRWRKDAAAWFVLTGDVPFVKPLNVRVRLNSSANVCSYLDAPYDLEDPHTIVETAEITIVAEPWVDAEAVAKAYRDATRQLRAGGSAAKSGDNRKKNHRTLDAIRFAARHIRESGRIKWPEITARWNAEQNNNPERRYKSRNTLRQALARFLQPRYGSPTFMPYESEPWQRQREAATARKDMRIRSYGSPETSDSVISEGPRDWLE